MANQPNNPPEQPGIIARGMAALKTLLTNPTEEQKANPLETGVKVAYNAITRGLQALNASGITPGQEARGQIENTFEVLRIAFSENRKVQLEHLTAAHAALKLLTTVLANHSTRDPQMLPYLRRTEASVGKLLEELTKK